MRKSNGHSVTHGGATVTAADTYALPDGRLVRAFVERLDLPEPKVLLYLPEDWALDDMAAFTAGGGGLRARSRGTAPPAPTDWTLADLTPADAAAWDDAVTRLGGRPWIPGDGMLSSGESTEAAPASGARGG